MSSLADSKNCLKGTAVRSNAAVYIDAGYLLASAATRLTGSSLRRAIRPDYGLLTSGIIRQAGELAALPILRAYWYDAALATEPDPEQRSIGMLPQVKLRLGRTGYEGQQKGVDLKMGLDMVTHARNAAIDTVILLSGDDDLTEAVDQAQMNGVEVILLAVPDGSGKPHGVSRHLHAAADRLETVDPEILDSAIIRTVLVPAASGAVAVHGASTKVPERSEDIHPSPAQVARPRPSPPRKPSAATASPTPVYSTATGEVRVAPHVDYPDRAEIDPVIARVVRTALDAYTASATDDQIAQLKSMRPTIPRDLDSSLLRDLSDALEMYELTDPQRFALRDEFWAAIDRL